MTVALKILVGYLLLELAAYTFIFLCTFKAAGTISTRATKTFLHCLDDLGVLIKTYLHYLYSSISELILAFGT